jgi:hypothetical protein
MPRLPKAAIPGVTREVVLVSAATLVEDDEFCDRVVCGKVKIARREIRIATDCKVLRNDFMKSRSERLRVFCFGRGNSQWRMAEAETNNLFEQWKGRGRSVCLSSNEAPEEFD